MLQKIKFMLVSLLAATPMLVPAVAMADAGTQVQNGVCAGATTLQIQGNQGNNFSPGTTACSTDETDATNKVNNLISQIINIFSVIVGVVAVIMIVVGGFRYITSGGDSGKVGSAKNTILYALIGLIIVALAQLIVHFVLAKTLGAGNGTG